MRRLCICLALVLFAGCNRQDTEALERINRKVRARAEALTGEVRNSAPPQWPGSADAGLDSRVALRLRWDKQLADTSVQVKANGKVIELTGKVRNLEQRRRVMMLAESTAGVEGVRDLLVESDR
jgi:hypothetical protein